MKRVAFIIAPFLLIQGCGDEVSVRDVCDNTPGMCSDLNTDGHCNVERSQVIVARHYEKAQPTDENKYTLLDNFEQYSRCIYRAAGIEHIKLKDKKTSRVNGYLTSLAEIKRLSNETVNSTYPKLLYYHWSRNGSEEAMEKLLQQEQQAAMQTSEMQFLLATYFIKFDLEKTLDLLYLALQLNPAGETVNTEIYTSLVNIFYKQKNYKHAYIWGLIAQESGVKKIDLAPLENLLQGEGKSLDALQDLADKTYDEINNGEFISPRGF
ncbi:hypothetical protein PULV_a1852 [Pseudoalteromonas ulvae UL12]|uniref:DUF2989 domain-containing protein n=1 Tax=Pseudoalteromonas ulvae TaxID=107327 RepID=UPI000A39BF12|nr:DUF2989 domain-containing protein [Pseudoalteromonas ulvae]MBE0364253.1 hypothetical protein [Pseudoalteromonas ulvae UL12]